MNSIPGSVGYITYPMFIEPTITWVPSGFSGYIWPDTKIVLKKLGKKRKVIMISVLETGRTQYYSNAGITVPPVLQYHRERPSLLNPLAVWFQINF